MPVYGGGALLLFCLRPRAFTASRKDGYRNCGWQACRQCISSGYAVLPAFAMNFSIFTM